MPTLLLNQKFTTNKPTLTHLCGECLQTDRSALPVGVRGHHPENAILSCPSSLWSEQSGASHKLFKHWWSNNFIFLNGQKPTEETRLVEAYGRKLFYRCSAAWHKRPLYINNNKNLAQGSKVHFIVVRFNISRSGEKSQKVVTKSMTSKMITGKLEGSW